MGGTTSSGSGGVVGTGGNGSGGQVGGGGAVTTGGSEAGSGGAAGTSTVVDTSSPEGCSCQTGRTPRPGLLAVALVVPALAWYRRRSARRRVD